MSSHSGPTLVFSEPDEFVEPLELMEAMDLSDLSGENPLLSEIVREMPMEEHKTISLYPSVDEREAIMANLQQSLRPEAVRGTGTTIDSLRRTEEREMRTRAIMEDIRGICDGNLPRLNDETESPLTQFQQTISRYEDITCLNQDGSNGRAYFLFEEPLGSKKLTVVKSHDHVILNNVAAISAKDFSAIRKMEYASNGCIVCTIHDGFSVNVPAASIPLLLAAVQRLQDPAANCS